MPGDSNSTTRRNHLKRRLREDAATQSNQGDEFLRAAFPGERETSHGTGTLYVKWGSYHGRSTTPDVRRVNPTHP
jgi:hypothetical protein